MILFSGKLLNQGRKGRWYKPAAVDENSPYRVAGEDRSYLGNAGKSFVNIVRYQHLISDKSRLGGFNMSRAMRITVKEYSGGLMVCF